MHISKMFVGLGVGLALLIAPTLALAYGPYTSSSTGYDISYNTTGQYPSDITSKFGVVGVSHGKAFTHNNQLAAEFAWAQKGVSQPTLYMNINTPVGKSMHGNTNSSADPYNVSPCPKGKAGKICQATNYGWNVAADAYGYATSTIHAAANTTWWLDIETANSWSGNLAVNAATIQGAIDFFKARGLTAGVYSTPGMWNAIVGSWKPNVPEWLADGITTQSNAAASCTNTGFTGGNIWLVQFIDKAISVDQDYAC